MTKEEILAAALALPPIERVKLVLAILESLKDVPDPTWDPTWVTETEGRMRALLARMKAESLAQSDQAEGTR